MTGQAIVLTILLSLAMTGASSLPAAEATGGHAPQTAPPTGSTKCILSIKGGGGADTGGISAASMSCIGDEASIAPTYGSGETPLRAPGIPSSGFTGVAWDDSCSNNDPCLLTICGHDHQTLVLEDILITDVGVPPRMEDLIQDRGGSLLVPEAPSTGITPEGPAAAAPAAGQGHRRLYVDGASSLPDPSAAAGGAQPAAAAVAEPWPEPAAADTAGQAGRQPAAAAAAVTEPGPQPVPLPAVSSTAAAAAGDVLGFEPEDSTEPAAVAQPAGPGIPTGAEAAPIAEPGSGPVPQPGPTLPAGAEAAPLAEPGSGPIATGPGAGPLPEPGTGGDVIMQAPTWEQPRALLCIYGPSSFKVTLKCAQISNNAFTGIMVGGAARLTVTDNSIFRNNSVAMAGGGLAAYGTASVTVTGGTVFSDNVAWNSQGAGLDAAFNATVTITGCTIFRNNSCIAAMTSMSSGGGVHAGVHARMYITNTTFDRNNATNGGGAVWGSDWSFTSIGAGTVFMNNSASSPGSDVKIEPFSGLEIADGAGVTARSDSVQWLKIENCSVGQVLTNGYCQWCQQNTYSFNPEEPCHPCEPNADCTGANELIPQFGHWHSSNYSTQIHPCPRPKVCNNTEFRQQCVDGYEGNLCGSCMPGFSWNGPFRCGECLSRGLAITLYLLGGLALFLVVYFSVTSTLRDNLLEERSVCASDLVKLLLRHLQYLAVVGALRVEWGPALSGVFAFAGAVFQVANTGGVVSVDCVMPESNLLPPAIRRSIAYLVAPIALLVAVLLARLIKRAVMCAVHAAVATARSGSSSSSQQQQHLVAGMRSSSQGGLVIPSNRSIAKLKYELPVTFLVTLFTFYPWLVRVGLSFFACYTIDTPRDGEPYQEHLKAYAKNGWWIFDIQQQCFEGWHKTYALALGVPCVILFCVVVPVAVALLLVLNQSKLHETGFREAFGFLYRDYKHQGFKQDGLKFLWEVVIMVQMIGIVAVSVYSYTLGPYYSMVVLSLSFAVFCGMQIWWKPFQEQRLHNTSIASLLCMYLTTVIALTLFRFDMDEEASPAYKAYMSAAGVFGLLVNVAFIAWCCYDIVMHSRGPVMRWMKKVTEYVKQWCHQVRAEKQQQGQQGKGADEIEIAAL